MILAGDTKVLEEQPFFHNPTYTDLRVKPGPCSQRLRNNCLSHDMAPCAPSPSLSTKSKTIKPQVFSVTTTIINAPLLLGPNGCSTLRRHAMGTFTPVKHQYQSYERIQQQVKTVTVIAIGKCKCVDCNILHNVMKVD